MILLPTKPREAGERKERVVLETNMALIARMSIK